MRIWECYKNIVDCFYSADNWLGVDAKWIDLCFESSDEDLDLFTKQWQYAESVKYYVGNGSNSTDCWKLPFTSSSIYQDNNAKLNFLEIAQNNLVKYSIEHMLGMGNILGKDSNPEIFTQ